MARFELTSEAALTTLSTLHGELDDPASNATTRNKLVIMFHDLSQRLKETLASFRTEQAELKELQNLVPPSNTTNETQATVDSNTRVKRDFAEYIGLASTGELAELNNWVAKIQTSETKLAHSAEQQLSYLNRAIKRLNKQEDRLNQLSVIELGWEKTINQLQQRSARAPVYTELTLTLIQGIAVVDYYTSNLRFHLAEDLQRLRLLSSNQLPPGLLTLAEYRQILHEVPRLDKATFSFSDSVESLIAELYRTPVHLLRDFDNGRLYAQLNIPIYEHAHSYQLYQILPIALHHPSLPGVHETIDLPISYLAVSDNQYFSLDPITDLHLCGNPVQTVRAFMEKDHLCATPHAIITYQANSPISSCAASLYYEPDVPLPSPCKTRVHLAPANPLRHVRNNVWMYQPHQTGTLSFACPQDDPPPVTLHPNGGQIFMPRNCRGHYGQIQIPARAETEIHFALADRIHLAHEDYNASYWITETPLPPSDNHDKIIRRVKAELGNSTHLSMPLDHFKRTLEKITAEIDQNAVTHFMQNHSAAPHAGTLATVAILIIIIGCICCLGRCCWRKYTLRRDRPAPQVIPMVTFAPPATPANHLSSPQIEEYHDDIPSRHVPTTSASMDNPVRTVARRARSRTRSSRLAPRVQ